MTFRQNVLAVVWDFDKTLISHYMQDPLFEAYGVEGKQFWDEVTLEVSPTIAAVSTCLFVFVAVLIALAEWLRRRSANR